MLSSIPQVIIYKRDDACCKGSLNNFKLLLSETEPQRIDEGYVCAVGGDESHHARIEVKCPEAFWGRYVRIQTAIGDDRPSICEVEVMGVLAGE